jgi:predicted alpha/beta hydrolase family esterase
MKRVFIVHRWGGSQTSDWYQWLKSELEKRRYEVNVLAMPNADEPVIKKWVSHLSNKVGKLDSDTFFVGHSIGCQTIMRYLATQNNACGGAVFVAGWFTLQGLESEDEEAIAKPWIETPMDYMKVKKNLPRSLAIFSGNDPYVPLDNKDIFKTRLGSDIIVERNKGHFTGEDAELLPAILPFFK